MLLQSYFHKNQIKLTDKPFAGGGEGNLFHILQPEKSKGLYIAKLYHPHKLGPERQNKLHFLYKHPPVELTENQHPSVVWVVDLLYDQQDKLIGFVMPFVKGEKLEILCTNKLPKDINKQWFRFDLSNPEARKLRMRLCFNIAVAIYEVHSTQNYVLVDLKPDNIIVQPNGLIALVDMDSVEVVSGSTTLFDAPVATPEYTPSEFYLRDKLGYDPTARQEWDLFALAVIFYKLLFGIHPFAAGNKPPFDHCVTLEQKIEAGLFVHASEKKPFMEVIPPPHQAFSQIPKELQDLFIQCFANGHQEPTQRPTAEEWCAALLRAIGDPSLHNHFDHLFTAQYFNMQQTLVRKSACELYSSLGIEDDVKQNLKPGFMDFEIPTIANPPKLLPEQTVKFNKKDAPNGWKSFAFLAVLGIIIICSGSSEGMIVIGIFSIIIGIILWPATNSILFVGLALNQEKIQIEARLDTAKQLFREQADRFIEWSQKLKSININALQEGWNSFLEKTKAAFSAEIASLDQKIQALRQEENYNYTQISQNFMSEILQSAYFQDLEGDNPEALRDNLNKKKENTPVWQEKREIFNNIAFKYRHEYILLKKSFDEAYQKLMDEAKACREFYKDKILMEQIRLQSTIISADYRKILVNLLEPIPKYLANMKIKIEALQLRKEELKNITFKNYKSGKWRE